MPKRGLADGGLPDTFPTRIAQSKVTDLLIYNLSYYTVLYMVEPYIVFVFAMYFFEYLPTNHYKKGKNSE